MKRLSKAQAARHAELADQLDTARGNLEAAVSEFNERVSDLFEELVADAAAAVVDAVDETNEFIGEVQGELDDYASGRSEKWTESEAGEAFAEWRGCWEEISAGDADGLEAPHLDEPDAGEDFDDTTHPTEAGS